MLDAICLLSLDKGMVKNKASANVALDISYLLNHEVAFMVAKFKPCYSTHRWNLDLPYKEL
jgi:hypothetical protein